MARDREPAVRVRLSPSVEAIIARSGVHLLRGREAFYVDARGAKKLVDVYREIETAGFDGAVGALLPDSPAQATAD